MSLLEAHRGGSRHRALLREPKLGHRILDRARWTEAQRPEPGGVDAIDLSDIVQVGFRQFLGVQDVRNGPVRLTSMIETEDAASRVALDLYC